MQDKTCTHCGVSYPKTQEFFYFRAANTTDRLSSWCKNCTKIMSKEYRTYPEARAKFKTRRSQHKQEMRKLINDYKMSKGCKDCGYNLRPEALDLDHQPQFSKKTEVSKILGLSAKQVWEEVSKCEVVCANCHRIRTFNRKQHLPK